MAAQPAIPFEALANLFVAEGALASPAELHGFLCGWVSTQSQGDVVTAVTQALDAELGSEKLSGVVSALAEVLREQLTEVSFEWQLLLPDEDCDLDVRVKGVADWCQGYTLAMGLAGEASLKGLSQDSFEGLADISEIGQIQLGEDLDSAEADMVELVEFVRVVAMNIYLELNQQAPPPANDDQIH